MGATQPLTFPNQQIHCIIPPVNGIGGLYISSVVAARDIDLLQSLGIKAVITTAYEAADLKYPSQIVPHHLFIEARDDYQFNLYDYFDSSVDWITKNLRMTNVLVHCIGGKSRSASLIIAYLIRERGMTRDDAISHMKSIRRQVGPNFGFRCQLQEYEKNYLGKKNFYPISPPTIRTAHVLQNRNLGEIQTPVYRAY